MGLFIQMHMVARCQICLCPAVALPGPPVLHAGAPQPPAVTEIVNTAIDFECDLYRTATKTGEGTAPPLWSAPGET